MEAVSYTHLDVYKRQALDRNIQKAREGGVVIPTFENMKHPETVPEPIRARLRGVGLWDVDPLNLFRITWKNEPMESGGLYLSLIHIYKIVLGDKDV